MSVIILPTVLLATLTSVCLGNDALLEGNNNFGLDLLTHLLNSESGNLWISPISIESCFGLAYAGAMEDTASQIAEVLNYPDSTSGNSDIIIDFFDYQSDITTRLDGSILESYTNTTLPLVRFANRIYIDTGFETYIVQSYEDLLGAYFNTIDFSNSTAAIATVNEWISDQTNEMIPEAITSLPAGIVMLLINTLLIEGSWHNAFSSSYTSESDFYGNIDRSEVASTVHLMHNLDYYPYYASDTHQFVRLDAYGSNDLSVLIALPKQSSTNAITDLSLSNIETALSGMESTRLALAIPKLSITANYKLKDVLQSMRMVDAFEDSANFSGIASESIQISDVIHSTALEINEDGFSAAAVTIIMAVATGIDTNPPSPVLFKADHRFQLFIVDSGYASSVDSSENVNVVLFAGDISEPTIPDGSSAPFDEATEIDTWETQSVSDSSAFRVTYFVSSFVIVCISFWF